MNKQFFVSQYVSFVPMQISRGFSLIETLVAVSVLMLAVVGPLSIASRGLISAQYARDQITAFHLAREATELVRNTRDTNMLLPAAVRTDWLNGLDACRGSNICKVDPLTGTFSVCTGSSCPTLLRNATTGIYGYGTGWESTPFTRNITIRDIVPGEEIVVEVEVLWETGVLTKSFVITEHFFNWK